VRRGGTHQLGGAQCCSPAEDDDVEQRIAAQSVCPMHGDAGGLSNCHQARLYLVRITGYRTDNLAAIICWDTSHIVMRGWKDGDRFPCHIDPGKDSRRFRDSGEPRVQNLGIEVLEMQENVIFTPATAAAIADLDRHGAADHVARGQVFG
jgi:hypothetical protein